MTESPPPTEQPEVKPSGAPSPPIETDPEPSEEERRIDESWQTLPLTD